MEEAESSERRAHAWSGARVERRWLVHGVLALVAGAGVAALAYTLAMSVPYAASTEWLVGRTAGFDLVMMVLFAGLWDARFRERPARLAFADDVSIDGAPAARGRVTSWKTLRVYANGRLHVALRTASRERIVVATRGLGDTAALLVESGAPAWSDHHGWERARFLRTFDAVACVGIAWLAGVLLSNGRDPGMPVALVVVSGAALVITFAVVARARVVVGPDGIAVHRRGETERFAHAEIERLHSADGAHLTLEAGERRRRWTSSKRAIADVRTAALVTHALRVSEAPVRSIFGEV